MDKKFSKNFYFRGFTLIEILVIISVIAFLASVGVVAFTIAKNKARIAKGLQFGQSVHNALGSEAVGIWGFDEGSGTTALDGSGNGKDGIIHGASYVSDTPFGSGHALQFTGSLQYVQASAVPVNYNLTLSAWIYPKSLPSERATIIKGSDPAGYYLSLASDGSIQCYWYGTSPAGYHSSGANTILPNQWSHALVTWNGSKAKLYINGIMKKAVSVTGSGTAPSFNVMGAESSNRQFIGYIDDARIYSQALESAQIKSLYLAGLNELYEKKLISLEEYENRLAKK